MIRKRSVAETFVLRPALRGFMLVALLAISARPGVAQLSVAEVAKVASPALVSVKVLFRVKSSVGRGGGGDGVVNVQRPGSGIIVSSGGLVVTNAHLVDEVRDDGEYWLSVTLAGGRRVGATIVARDERTDLALLQLDMTGGERLPALVLSGAEVREAGARVVAASAPDGTNIYVFAGSMAFASGPVRLREALLEAREVLLSDARFHGLLDGGPLLDMQGRVLGIHNSSHLSSLPLGFDRESEDSDEIVSSDYAVIVSAAAIQRAFATRLDPPAPSGGSGPGASVAGSSAAIRAIAPSVVSVFAGDESKHPALPDPADPQGQRIASSLGSGVVIDAAGLVLTTSDLFGVDVTMASVRLADGSQYPARLVARRSKQKLALLEVELPADVRLTAARLADSTQVIVGEPVAAVARPFTGALTTSVGVLSALERDGLLQVASWIHPGHYGGALVDHKGRLLGIAVKQRESEKRVDERSYMGFAAPIATAVEEFAAEWMGASAAFAAGGKLDEVGRRTAVTRVAERTRSCLINVLIEKAPEPQSGGFDPFGAVDTERVYTLHSQGSGVVIDASGLALSNWHVVDSALDRDGNSHPDYRIRVTLADGRSFDASVLSTSRDDDLSLLALELEPGETLAPVVLGDSSALRTGDPLVAIGNALGLSDSVSAGVVSVPDIGTRIQGRLHPYDHMIMTDAAINPGNSGGALLDMEGRLIGINTAGRSGMGMAIPVSKAREVFRGKLLSAARLRSVYLGLNVEEREGALRITWLDAEGPGARSGALVGDNLLALGAARVTSVADFARRSLELEPSMPCTVRLERDGEPLEVELRPMSYVAWEILAQSGIELAPVDYSAESELVRAATVALHRNYTEDPDAYPSHLMGGALRVVQVRALEGRTASSLEPGDLLLGVTSRRNGDERLLRLETLADLGAVFAPLASAEGEVCTCWVWRDGSILLTRVFVRRPPR